MYGGIEAYRLQEAFARLPGPPGPQKHAKSDEKRQTRQKSGFLTYFLPYFSSKGRIFRIFLVFGVTAVVMSHACKSLVGPEGREDG